MSTFQEQLTGAHKEQVIADLVAFGDRTVDNQSGLSGKLVKGAYAAAKKVDSTIAEKAVRRLLPELAKDLQPFWDEYVASGRNGSFGTFLEARKGQVSSVLLETADRKAGDVTNPNIHKIYSTVRSKAAKMVESNVGPLGDTLARHVSDS